MTGVPKLFPGAKEAVYDWKRGRRERWSVERTLRHFRETYPQRFANVTTYEGVRYAVRAAAQRMALLEHEGDTPPNTNSFSYDLPPLRIPHHEKYLVTGDVHAPVHTSRGVALVAKTTEALDLDALVIGGDFWNMGYKGHKGNRNVRADSYAENVFTGAQILNLWSRHVKRVYLCLGNHDEKPWRDTDQELTFSSWFSTAVGAHLEFPDRFTVADRYYMVMEPRAPIAGQGTHPDHFEVSFNHQKEYGRNQLGVAKRLADVQWCNVVSHHQHHGAVGMHPSGKAWLMDAGTLQDPDQEYKVARPTTHPHWRPGFGLVTYNVPEFLDLRNPDEWWCERLGINAEGFDAVG